MQLTRSQVEDADDMDDFWSERESEPCCWMDHERAEATRPSSRLASCARRGNIYPPDGVYPSTGCHKRAPSGTRHTGVRWYQYPKPYGDGQLRSVPQPAPPLPLPPRRLENGRPVIQEAVPPLSSLFSPPPPSHRSLQAGHMQGWLLHL